MDTISEQFEQQVRDCLAHLYDFTALQNDPLAQQLAPSLTGLQRIQTVRQIMIEAIENLNLNKSRQGRAYNLLFLRYIEEQPLPEVLQALALSERQFYREHRKALQALSQVLWERVKQEDDTNPRMISVETEVQRAYDQTEYTLLDAGETLAGMIEATQGLAEKYGVTLRCEAFEYPFYSHRMILRQTLILLASELITHLGGGVLDLSFDALQPTIIFGFDGDLQQHLQQQETLKHLVQTLQASLTFETGKVSLHLHMNRQTVLIIDDNPDAINLMKRYLAHLPYTVLSTHNADEGLQLAREHHPRAIILDIMLPGKDGWELLQTFKNHPTTGHIPVFICSVLDTPDLALSLGADGFLKKPPRQADLLNAIR